jgi:hypothetical protein
MLMKEMWVAEHLRPLRLLRDDYGNYLIHVISPKVHADYDLERLWKRANEVPFPA